MAAKRTVELGANAEGMERRTTRLLLPGALVVVAVLVLIGLGAALAMYVAELWGLARQASRWLPIDATTHRIGAEVVVWIGTLIAAGLVLMPLQRRYGTLPVLLGVLVLTGVALFAVSFEDLAAYMEARR